MSFVQGPGQGQGLKQQGQEQGQGLHRQGPGQGLHFGP